MNGYIVVCPYNRILFSQEKESQECWYMLWWWWILKHAKYKEVRHKRPHIVWFHFYETSRIGKSKRKKQIGACQGLGGGGSESYCWMDKAFYFAVIKVLWRDFPGGAVVKNPPANAGDNAGVWALVREDPTCCGETKPVCHNYWACALEPGSYSYWAHVPQLLKPTRLEPVLPNKRSHRNEE